MSKHLPCFRTRAIHLGARLPSTGSHRAWFASLRRYYARTKTAACPSPAFRYPSRTADSASACCSCPVLHGSRRIRRTPPGRAVGHAGLGHSGCSRGKTNGSPRFPGNPSCLCPALRPRRKGVPMPDADTPGRSPLYGRESLPEAEYFRGSITRLQHPPPTLPDSVALHGQGWLPAAGQALPDGVRLTPAPARFHSRISVVSSLVPVNLLSRRTYPGATYTYCYVGCQGDAFVFLMEILSYSFQPG